MLHNSNVLCLMHFNDSSEVLKDYTNKTKWYTYGNPYIDKSKYVFNGGSLRLDGPNFIYSVDPTLVNFFNTTEEFTVDFWVRYDGVGRLDYETPFTLHQRAFSNFDTDYRSLEICKCCYASPVTSIGRVSHYSRWNTSIPYGSWFHVAGVLKDNVLKTYLNGKLVSSIDRWGIYTQIVVIGGGGSQYHVGLYGNVDEFRICDVAVWDDNFDVNKDEYIYGNYKLFGDDKELYSLINN